MIENDSIDTNGPVDVLELSFAEVAKADVDLPRDLIEYCA